MWFVGLPQSAFWPPLETRVILGARATPNVSLCSAAAFARQLAAAFSPALGFLQPQANARGTVRNQASN